MNLEERKRENGLRLVEDHIGRHLAGSHASGELTHAPSFGKPLNFGDGYDDTPAELRMPMKILKDAGVMPHEITLMREAAALQTLIDDLGLGEALDRAGTAAHGVRLIDAFVRDTCEG